jgi:hypothetical protein
MVDYRARRRMPPHGRADAAVVAAMRKAIGEAAEDSARTAAFVFRRTREILTEDGSEPGRLPSERTLYRLFGRLGAGRHTTGSARTRRFRVKGRWHDDRWQPSHLMPWADDAAARLAVISGSTAAAIKNALPAFGGSHGGPSGPSPHATSARQPAASASQSRSTCPPTTRSASSTASGCPDREHRNSASEAAPTSSPPNARPATSSAAAPSSS